MARHTEHDTGKEISHMRALLVMARESMQVESACAVLALAGQAMAELAEVDSALLLVRGGMAESIGFDSEGRPYRATAGHPWYRCALDELEGSGDAVGTADPRIMLVSVPGPHAMAVLAAGWTCAAPAAVRDERRRSLATILELSIAALGRIASRTALEDLVTAQYRQMADDATAHADELARRDRSDSTLRSLALIDVLTGLANRRGFYVQAEHLFRLARRKHAGCSILHADIDGLKLVNDQLGHAAGDRLIQDAAAVLRESLRDSDVLARFGGDEFVAFVFDDAHPRVMLARLRDNLQAFNLMQERSYRLAVSAGAVRCDPAGGTALADYVQLADREMYLHKRSQLH